MVPGVGNDDAAGFIGDRVAGSDEHPLAGSGRGPANDPKHPGGNHR